MQPTLCAKCHKNVAVVFVQRIENGENKTEGLCLNCAREMGIKPVDDMIQKMGLSDDDVESLTSEMLSAFGGAEGMEGMERSEEESESDEEDEGKTATFPFLNKLFGGGAAASGTTPPDPASPAPEKGSDAPKAGKEDKSAKGKDTKRKFLENYCISLTNKAAEGKLDNIVGRDEEIARTIQILNRRQKNNPCLIGEPGVGKTAIAEGLALRIHNGDVPYKLQDKEVYLLDLTALVAGTQFRGQFESRMKGLIDEVKKLGNIILVIDEVHNIVGAGDAEGSMNAANILKPALSRGEIQVIGATTLTEYRKYIEKDSALERRFQPVMVEEPSIEDAVKILQGIAPYYEKYHFVSISPAICRSAVTMSERYITDRYLPDKAIDLIDEACSDVNLHNKALAREAQLKKELAELSAQRETLMNANNNRDLKKQNDLKANEARQGEIRRKLSSLAGEHAALSIDPAQAPGLKDNEREQAGLNAELERLTEERVKLLSGEQAEQDFEQLAQIKSREMRLQAELSKLEAMSAPPLTMEHLARVIELWTKIPASQIQEQEYERLAHLQDRLREHIIGQDQAVDEVSAAVRRGRVGIASKRKPVSFIFVGSTGVGKTELVKRLAQDMFNSPESLIRLDMSEFMEKFSVSRIIGSPPGYVGYDEAGQLTEKVRRKPYCVILFDEIEKAHPDVLNILLQILDDGHITDAQGRNVNFENTVIVMTSNAGSTTGSTGSVGFGRSETEQGKAKAMKALEGFLRPEFINRVDEIVYFNKLSEDNFKDIAKIMLGELSQNLQDKGITLTYNDDLLDYLVRKSYSQTYGARNLRRQIQKDLEDPIATKIIDSYMEPISKLTVAANGESLTVNAE
ncbi:ATP-dependent Clp protease ATP-binding subunit [Vermiculatibacterium agrestimuris]|uniref:ATP-dependent Clp protease ATP-binding subunit n=1 Tax=Vermiculatibacterium agrestimuris TaxID=2941519 RepID=UPI0020404829|nr:ATP-dependent Clp protease ATP-binding subunit [Vermiculatibacterium agrestimuris]